MNQTWRKFILGCTAGNILEWYDFILYGYFSPIFAHIFFPTENTYVAMMLTYAIFALGCVTRPLGSLFFGHVGDKHGRKLSLVITIALISIATVSMGLLPTYNQAGVWAPILLMACRLLQGAAVSGEEVGAAIFLTENAPKERQALAGSIIFSSVFGGLLLGAVTVFSIFVLFSHAQVLAFAWRIPFLLAGILGAVALYIRLVDFESPWFLSMKDTHQTENSPIKSVMKHHLGAVVRTLSLAAVQAISIYLFVVYLPTYFTVNLHLSLSSTLLISVVTLSLMSCLVLLFGLIADKVGHKKIFALGCAGFIVTAYPIFHLLTHKTYGSVIAAEALLMFFLSCTSASIFPVLISYFPKNVRFTGMGAGFNLAMTLFGSTAPIISLSLIKWTGAVTAPCWYLFGAAVLSFVALSIAMPQAARERHLAVETV